MVDYRIDVTIDPSLSAAGAKQVERQLGSIEREAADLRAALTAALGVRDQGVASALGRIEEALSGAQETAALTDARLGQLGRDAQGLDRIEQLLTHIAEQSIIVNTRLGQIGRDIQATGVRKVNDELERTARTAASIGPLLARAFAGISVGLVVREFGQLSDVVQNTQNRLRLVTGTTSELADVQARLFKIAEQTRTSFEGTSTIFSRLAVSSKELGVTNSQLLDFTESLNQAIVLSGASAQEASNGLIQLSQGMASGALRGDELRSVLEQLPAVADVIAKGLGVTRGELRELGKDGQITSKVILDAFESSRTELADKFATTVPTIGQAFEVLKTNLTDTVGRFNEVTGAASLFASVILSIGEFLAPVDQGLTEFATDAAGSANSLGAAINTYRKEIESLNASATADSQLTGARAERLAFLQEQLDKLTGSVRARMKAEVDAVATTAQALATDKEQIDAFKRQQEVLDKIKKPFEEYAVLQEDLAVLLHNNAITQDEFNAALDKAKPEAAGNPFEEQVKSLREQNAELEIRAHNQGIQQEGLLIELELQRKGVTLTGEQRSALASQLIVRKDLNDQIEAQKTKEEKLAEAAQKQAERIASLKQQFQLGDQINQQLADLLALRKEEGALIPQIDTAIENLRLRQLAGSKDLGDGFERAFIKIQQEATNLAAVGEQVVGVFANDATDAIVEFVRTGTFSFKDFASSVLADLTKIIARLLVVQGLNAVIGAVSGGETTALNSATNAALNSGRAGGGTTQPNQRPFMVGEKGPELFTPNQTGTITPNAASLPQQAPAVNLQVVNVTDPNEVPRAINSGIADDAIVNVLQRKREALRQIQS